MIMTGADTLPRQHLVWDIKYKEGILVGSQFDPIVANILVKIVERQMIPPGC
jgi:hypothetical protein